MSTVVLVCCCMHGSVQQWKDETKYIAFVGLFGWQSATIKLDGTTKTLPVVCNELLRLARKPWWLLVMALEQSITQLVTASETICISLSSNHNGILNVCMYIDFLPVCVSHIHLWSWVCPPILSRQPSPIIVTTYIYLHLLVLSTFHHILFVFMDPPLCVTCVTPGTVSEVPYGNMTWWLVINATFSIWLTVSMLTIWKFPVEGYVEVNMHLQV